jgi:hypothetical protein
VGCKSRLLKQYLNTHKQQLRVLGLQIMIHRTHVLHVCAITIKVQEALG